MVREWSEESIFNESQLFFEELWRSLEQAQKSIDIEVYILSDDPMGKEFTELLQKKANEGVRVRLLVDGVGSFSWVDKLVFSNLAQGIDVRVYHPVPWPFSRFSWSVFFDLMKAVSLYSKINRRNHKKIFSIDGKRAFIGSHNISQESLSWRETGVSVEGSRMKELVASFEFSWTRGHRISDMQEALIKRKLEKMRTKEIGLVRTNETRRRRRHIHGDLVRRIGEAKTRVDITTPYFVPPKKIMRSLCQAGRRGVKVRLLLAGATDVPILKWVTPYFYRQLSRSGVEIYEYNKKILHSKVVLIDSFVTVGSSNFNHRSFFQDLEVDIELRKQTSLDLLEQQFQRDLDGSTKLIEIDHMSFSPFKWIIAKFLLMLREFL